MDKLVLLNINETEKSLQLTIKFIQNVFSGASGFLWLAAINDRALPQSLPRYIDKQLTVDGGVFDEEAFLNFIVNFINTHNIYFCVNLTRTKEGGRKTNNVIKSTLVYADLDAFDPKNLLLRPTYLVQTSNGKHQAFWLMESIGFPEDTSAISRKIANKHDLDACWDVVRYMRLPGTYNFKYLDSNNENVNVPQQVKIVSSSTAKYRVSDFQVYPKVEFKHVQTGLLVRNSQAYDELDIDTQERVDNYMDSAVEYELSKLYEISELGFDERYVYVTRTGEVQEYGWDRGCMWVARCLAELAVQPWNNYTLEQAEEDFISNAPTDGRFTKNDVYRKWYSAVRLVHNKARPFPKFISEDWGF